MCDSDIVMSFKGIITQELLADLGDIIRDHFEDLRHRPQIVKKIFSVFIEVAQNILHHSAEKIVDDEGGERGAGIVMMREITGGFEIFSGNLIENEHSKSIEESCHLINSLDRKELRRVFKEKINSPLESGHRSAGLGLIDIARKSDNKIDFEINRINDDHSFLMLSVRIDKQGSAAHG
jgi:hypothetical protein